MITDTKERRLCSRKPLLKRFLEQIQPRDVIFADRGFPVKDLNAKGGSLVLPASIKDKKQLSNAECPGWNPGGPYSGAQRVSKPKFRVGSNFRIISEQYFSGVENVAECLENIDNNLTYYEIPTQLACAYLKSHLPGWALDWFDVLGYKVVEDKATDYAHLKHALTE
ncbi:uncharacterized protein TNCV_566161 [Trichonephila clavipes]|nr:uncharacterized protein TNCV_566161 [Trichonephila clavipes]